MPRTRLRRRRSYRKSRKMVTRKRSYSRGRKSYGRRRAPKSLFAPTTKCVKLKYIDSTTTKISTLASTYIATINTNSAYDVNASLGNTSTPGFTEHGAFYKSYRIPYAVVTCTFVNMGTASARVGLIAVPSATTAISSWATLIECEGNPNTRSRILGPSTGSNNQVTLKLVVRMGQIIGNPLQYASDDTYDSIITNSPSKIIPTYIWAASIDNVTTIPDIGLKWNVIQYVRFRDRKYLTA